MPNAAYRTRSSIACMKNYYGNHNPVNIHGQCIYTTNPSHTTLRPENFTHPAVHSSAPLHRLHRPNNRLSGHSLRNYYFATRNRQSHSQGKDCSQPTNRLSTPPSPKIAVLHTAWVKTTVHVLSAYLSSLGFVWNVDIRIWT